MVSSTRRSALCRWTVKAAGAWSVQLRPCVDAQWQPIFLEVGSCNLERPVQA